MKSFKAAAVSMPIFDADLEKNFETASRHVASAAAGGAELVCLPEYLLTGPAMECFKTISEAVPGPLVEKVGRLAREYGVYLAFSMAEKDDRKIYNTGVLLGPGGDVVGKHRKMHLFLDENGAVERGGDYTVADTPLGMLGLLVCYDAVFPEASRKLALLGAEVLLLPANWPDPFRLQWDIATRSRALDNQIWLVASNRLGSSGNYTYFGGSRIIDPYGDMKAECTQEGYALATLEEASSKNFRGIVDFLRDRRTEYGL